MHWSKNLREEEEEEWKCERTFVKLFEKKEKDENEETEINTVNNPTGSCRNNKPIWENNKVSNNNNNNNNNNDKVIQYIYKQGEILKMFK